MTRGAGFSRDSRMGMLLRWGQASVFQFLHFRKIISTDLAFSSTGYSHLSGMVFLYFRIWPMLAIKPYSGKNHIRDK